MTTPTGEVHPVADLFPMLSPDELADLAADIAERGLLQPIVLDPRGRLLDGRNRLAACQLAGVEPEFTMFASLGEEWPEGDSVPPATDLAEADYAGYALSVNVARRHLGQGQRAMLVVAAGGVFPENTMREVAAEHEVSPPSVAKAQVVQRFVPELVGQVIAGASLNEAYGIARERKLAAEQESERRAALPEDLRGHVDAGELSVAEAAAAAVARRRQREEAERRGLLVAEVQTMADDFGPVPELAVPPDMLLAVDDSNLAVDGIPAEVDAAQVAVEMAGTGPSVADLEAQKAALTELSRIKADLRCFLRKHDPTGFEWGDMFLTGIRSALTQIVNEAHGVGHAYQAQQETRPKLRSVK